MVEIYEGYKKELSSKKIVLVSILIIFFLGLLFGSLYVAILDNNEKNTIVNIVNNYFCNFEVNSFDNSIVLFRHSLISNLLFFILIWLLGISVIGIPIIFLIIFFKSFIIGFSMASIFMKYRLIGIIGIIIYLFPSSIITLVLGIILASFSSIISIKLITNSFSKKTLNFGAFMGKYILLLLICILVSIICSLFDAFVSPYLYNLFLSIVK